MEKTEKACKNKNTDNSELQKQLKKAEVELKK
jgi:hypothetical protein